MLNAQRIIQQSYLPSVAVGFLAGRYGTSTDERHRRIIWRCNGKYPAKGDKGCESKHIDDKVLYQAFVSAFNIIVENKDYFLGKWQERLKGEDLLVRYRAKRFIIITETVAVTEFDVDVYFSMVEKMTVSGDRKVIVSLLDGTDVECAIE